MKIYACVAGIVFLALSLADVISLIFHIATVNIILKPLLVPSLMVAAL